MLPRGQRSRIAAIDGPAGPLAEAYAPQSVTVRLDDDIDVARGDMVVPADDAPLVTRAIEATVCWLADTAAPAGARVIVKHTTRTVRGRIEAIAGRLDLDSLGYTPSDALGLNDILASAARARRADHGGRLRRDPGDRGHSSSSTWPRMTRLVPA